MSMADEVETVGDQEAVVFQDRAAKMTVVWCQAKPRLLLPPTRVILCRRNDLASSRGVAGPLAARFGGLGDAFNSRDIPSGAL